MDKTEARRAVGSSFPGFTFISLGRPGKPGMCKPKQKKPDKFDESIKQITKRNRGVSAERMIGELNAYLRGWVNYYARGVFKNWLEGRASWIRRRVRQYLWKLWKDAGARREHLRGLGVPEWWLEKYRRGLSSNRYWRMAWVTQSGITKQILHDKLGLTDVEKLYEVEHRRRMEKDRTYNSQREFVFI